jgi:hypothetical protein
LADPERSKARVKKWQQENAERHNAYVRQRRQRPEVKLADRAGHLRRKFGMTVEEYERRAADQDGRCYLCGTPPAEGQSLDVDHDHRTGEVAKLLCRNCNQGLGKFFEDPGLMVAAAFYVLEQRYPDGIQGAELARIMRPPRERVAAR